MIAVLDRVRNVIKLFDFAYFSIHLFYFIFLTADLSNDEMDNDLRSTKKRSKCLRSQNQHQLAKQRSLTPDRIADAEPSLSSGNQLNAVNREMRRSLTPDRFASATAASCTNSPNARKSANVLTVAEQNAATNQIYINEPIGSVDWKRYSQTPSFSSSSNSSECGDLEADRTVRIAIGATASTRAGILNHLRRSRYVICHL